jgi:hypothetical protein
MLVGLEDRGVATVLASWGEADGEAVPAAALPPDELTGAIVTSGEPRSKGALVGAPVAGSGGRGRCCTWWRQRYRRLQP